MIVGIVSSSPARLQLEDPMLRDMPAVALGLYAEGSKTSGGFVLKPKQVAFVLLDSCLRHLNNSGTHMQDYPRTPMTDIYFGRQKGGFVVSGVVLWFGYLQLHLETMHYTHFEHPVSRHNKFDTQWMIVRQAIHAEVCGLVGYTPGEVTWPTTRDGQLRMVHRIKHNQKIKIRRMDQGSGPDLVNMPLPSNLVALSMYEAGFVTAIYKYDRELVEVFTLVLDRLSKFPKYKSECVMSERGEDETCNGSVGAYLTISLRDARMDTDNPEGQQLVHLADGILHKFDPFAILAVRGCEVPGLYDTMTVITPGGDDGAISSHGTGCVQTVGIMMGPYRRQRQVSPQGIIRGGEGAYGGNLRDIDTRTKQQREVFFHHKEKNRRTAWTVAGKVISPYRALPPMNGSLVTTVTSAERLMFKQRQLSGTRLEFQRHIAGTVHADKDRMTEPRMRGNGRTGIVTVRRSSDVKSVDKSVGVRRNSFESVASGFALGCKGSATTMRALRTSIHTKRKESMQAYKSCT
jgi:hypothetical protein